MDTQVTLTEIVNKHISPLIHKVGTAPSAEQTIGAAVGVYLNGQCYFFPFGVSTIGGAAPEETTLFQLGSVTKVFTTSLLGAYPYSLGLDPNDFYGAEIGDYVPAAYKLQDWQKSISFEQLATFTAGINPSSPKGQTEKEFIEFIDSRPEPNALPAPDEYSNSSIGLLGQILLSMSGYSDFADGGASDAWYWANLFSPLSMTSSGHTPPLGSELATFYAYESGNYKVVPQCPWVPWGTAGRSLSNVKDMLNFIQANLGVSSINNRSVPDALLKGMVEAQSPWANLGSNKQGFAWVRTENGGETMLVKNGGLPGTAAFIELCPDLKFGMIALANSGSDDGGTSDKMTGVLGKKVRSIMKELIPLA